ncbi:MAG: hypothetical protein E7605_02300 [Ruminococcaceae bacterium]|nr:hypothetical protein [Oscillospiraceae bacterium]
MPLRNPQNFLLSASAARGGNMARDAHKNFMSFSRSALKSGTEAVSKGGSLWRVFLVRSLPRGKE